MTLNLEGFFREMEHAKQDLPSVHERIGALDSAVKQALVDYLRAGAGVAMAPGLATDIVDPSAGSAGALGILTDGEWVWPNELAYYVERYDIALSDEFVAHARSNDWRVPEVPIERLEEIVDRLFGEE